jgi:hypothetical protein
VLYRNFRLVDLLVGSFGSRVEIVTYSKNYDMVLIVTFFFSSFVYEVFFLPKFYSRRFIYYGTDLSVFCC